MTRLGNRERHLLLSVTLLDGRPEQGVKSDAIVAAVSESLAKKRAADGGGDKKAEESRSSARKRKKQEKQEKQEKQPPPPPPPPLQVRFYSPHAGLCLLRSAFSESAEVRAVAPEVRFVGMRPVRLAVTRAFGSATCARRVLAQHLEEGAWAAAQNCDQRAAKDLRLTLSQLAELQKR
jgi:hypothetical protein